MYKIDTGQARTDLYGIGKGLAQVIDLSPMREQSKINQQLAVDEKKMKRKEESAREDAILDNLASASKIAIRPNDREYFNQKQSELSNFVYSNIDKLKSGDASSRMAFDKLYGQLMTESELSKNSREFAEAEFQKYNSNPSKYRKNSLNKVTSFLAAPEFAGNWDTTSIPLEENVDYMGRVNTVLSPIVDDIMVKNPVRSIYDKNSAKELIKKDILSDPILLSQANYELESAGDDELKAMGLSREASPIDFFAEKYSPYLTRDIKKDAYYTGFGGTKNELPELVVTTTGTDENNWEAAVDYAKPVDNPYQTIERNGKPVDVKPIKLIKRGSKFTVQVASKPTEGAEGKTFEIEYYGKDKAGTGEQLLNKMGVKNPFDLQGNGEAPSNIRLKKNPYPEKGGGKYTERQQSALNAFESQQKRKPTEKELEKILKKYE